MIEQTDYGYTSTDCKTCSSKGCGVCSDGYDKPCTGEVVSCPSGVTQGMSATKVPLKSIADRNSGKCWKNKQYQAGNGYTSLWVYTIDKQGRCVQCQDPWWWPPSEEGGSNFCWFEKEARKVLAGALVGAGGCSYQDIDEARLLNQCYSDSRRQSLNIKQRWAVTCNGAKRTVYLMSSGSISDKGINPYGAFEEPGTLKWSYAIKG
jgi:hypothetical protein